MVVLQNIPKVVVLELEDLLCNGQPVLPRDRFGAKKRPSELSLAQDAQQFLESHSGLLALITDGDGIVQRNKIRRLELAGDFDLMICTSDHGEAWRKPSVFSYQAVCQHFAVSPIDVLCVGSNVHTDFEAPQSLGMHTVRLLRAGQEPLEDLSAELSWLDESPQIHSLAELPRYLRGTFQQAKSPTFSLLNRIAGEAWQ